MLFNDRFDAALKLMPCLRKFENKDGVVYAIPGGGVPVGYYLSKDYNFPMELLFSKKIVHPETRESIGAVTLNDQQISSLSRVSKKHIENEVIKIRKLLKDQQKKFLSNRIPSSVKNKIAFIVDDGITTGNTMLAAISQVKLMKPKKIVIAVPFASRDSVNKLSQHVDEIVYLRELREASPVRNNYLNFPPVSDKEIVQLLNATYYTQQVA